MKAINSAAENGRMALVVPEGFLFRKDLAKHVSIYWITASSRA